MKHAALGTVLLLAGCALTRPDFSTQLTDQRKLEALAGVAQAPKLERQFGGLCQDQEAKLRMARVGSRLTTSNQSLQERYGYFMLASNDKNAFSLPGGRIYVTAGLYRKLNTDRLLAAALAHEMAHIAAKDSFKPKCRDLDQALQRELAADLLASRFLINAGFDGSALADCLLLVKDELPQGWTELRRSNLDSADRTSIPKPRSQVINPTFHYALFP